MNAKKIMGAVLVALLAAALFVGAGAAADTLDLGSVPAYTNLNGGKVDFSGSSFVSDDGKTVIYPTTYNGALYFAVNDEAYGKVYTGTAKAGSAVVSVKFTLVAPTATITALNNGISIIGQTVTEKMAQAATYTVEGFTGAYFVFIDEDGVIYDGKQSGQNAAGFGFTPGKWAVAANLTGKTGLPNTIQIIGLPYYFTVSETDAIISSVKDTVNIGQSIVLNVLIPGQTEAKVFFDGKVKYDATKPQAGVTYTAGNNYVDVALGIDGRGSVAFVADDAGETTFKLEDKYDVEVTVTIAEGVITAVADEEFFFVGNPLYLSGTTTAGKGLHFYVEGQNFLFTNIDDAIASGDLEFDGESWTVKIASKSIKDANGKTLIAGTYPVIVSLADIDTTKAKDVQAAGVIKKEVMESTYATASITLTQPFITDVSAPEIVVQGDGYKITGTAFAAKNVRLYVFGTNYFAVQGDETDKNEQFEFDILSSGVTQEMAVGTYFYLIQHPMKDTLFNVWNSSTEGKYPDFYYAATLAGKAKGLNAAADEQATFIFNAYTRGTNYAAQALLEEIAGQNIDDIFVQGTFEVEAKKLEINPIPAEVAKGTALTVTGYTNSGEGVEVIVNVLAGKFGATVKGDENAALFLTAKAVTKEDGTFEAKIDTSKLELGNYIVTVEIDGTQYDTAAVSIVDKAPVTPPADDKPDTPVTPPADDKPTEPETPGFGALAALAGLGAVAVLLLRRE